MTTRNILLTGGTGHQGRALIRALLHPSPSAGGPPPEPGVEYHIYALTRNSSSPAALKLQASEPDQLTVIQGDLDDRASMTAIFEVLTKSVGGVWGVYCVLAFPGLGANADGEEAQGKMMADLALQYRVSVFVFSSALRAGPQYDGNLETDAKAKYNIEQHCIQLGEQGLPWIILRPALFMETFEEFVGSITASVLKTGLSDETRVGVVASEDIGSVAAGVFRNPEKYMHRCLAVIGEFATMSQLEEIHEEATGKALTNFPSGLAWLILQLNKGTRDLNSFLTLMHTARLSNSYVELVAELELAQSAHRMMTYGDWLLRKGHHNKPHAAEPKAGWNQTSVGKLFTGRM